MRIKSITIKGFKSIKDQTVPLDQINILIGGNGIGKTNFISAFELLRDIYDRNLQRHVLDRGGAEAFLHLGKKTTGRNLLEIEIENKGEQNRYGVELRESQDRLLIDQAYTAYWSRGKWHTQNCDKNVEEATIQQDRDSQAWYVGPLLNQFEVYHFHDTGPRSPIIGYKPVDDNRKLKRDGSNIAPFLYYLQERHPSHFQRIERTVASIVPFFKSFNLGPSKLNPEQIRLEWRHTDNRDLYFNETQLSDGTLRFICLTTLLLQPELPHTILIDEPELGLHPQAINVLAALVQKASVHSQIIISTQSVTLVDNFTPEQTIVVDRQGTTSQYRRLNSEDLQAWLDDYSLGEIWEMNIIGGQPL